eukprot:gene22125-28230_t
MGGGAKLFFRHNVTLSTDLRIYHHTLSQCLEIVPHITHIAHSPTEMVLSSDTHDNQPDSAREPDAPTHSCFVALPRIYLNYTALLGCVMGTHRRNSGILAEDLPGATDGSRSPSVYRSRSLEVCLSNVVASFVNSHLKMVRPRRMSKQPHGGVKRTGSNSRHIGHSASTDSFKLAGTASTDVNDASCSMTPEASRSSSPQPSFMVMSPGAIYSPQALYSTPKHHAGVAARETPSPTHSSPNKSVSSRSSASPAASSLRSMAAAALPLSPSSIKVGGTGIAFDSLVSPRVPAVAAAGGGAVVLPTVDEVMLHSREYALFFDDADLLKVVDLSPVCRAPPDELVPILGVAVDQINVFYEPTITRTVSISDNFVVVGSNGYDYFEGIIHIYTPRDQCTWTLQSLIRSPSGANDNFGNSVSVDGLNFIAGANAKIAYTGVAYIYSFVNSEYWLKTATLTSPLGVGQGFGYGTAISGRYAMVSTAVNDAFIYENNGNKGWSLTADLAAIAHSQAGSYFGQSIAMAGDFAVVGADRVDGSFGAVHIFKVNNSDPSHPWTLFQTLPSVHGFNSFFGHSVDLAGRTLVVGAVGYVKGTYLDGVTGQPWRNNTGWIHVYDLSADNASFALTQSIQSPAGVDSYFGVSVAIHDVEIVAGAMGYGNSSGAAFVYRRSNHSAENATTSLHNAFELKVALSSREGKEGHFGFFTDIGASYAVVGSYGYDDLRGGISLVCRDVYDPPLPPPHIPSKPANQTGDGNSTKFSGGEGTTGSRDKWSPGMLIAMVLGAATAAGTTYMMIRVCISCCYVAPAALKKKKKKEDEDSPYSVHGPGGLLDECDDSEDGSSVYSEEFLDSYAETSISADYEDYSVEGEQVKKDKKDKKDKKKNKKGSLLHSEEKVYSYAGYQQGQGGDSKKNQEDKKNKERSRSVDLTSSSSSPCKVYGPGGFQRSSSGGQIPSSTSSSYPPHTHPSGLPRSPRGTVAHRQEQELHHHQQQHSSRQSSLNSTEFHSLSSSRQHSLGSHTDDLQSVAQSELTESVLSHSVHSPHHVATHNYHKQMRLQEEQDRLDEAERVRAFFETQRLSCDQFDSSSQVGLLVTHSSQQDLAGEEQDLLRQATAIIASRSASLDFPLRRCLGVTIDTHCHLEENVSLFQQQEQAEEEDETQSLSSGTSESLVERARARIAHFRAKTTSGATDTKIVDSPVSESVSPRVRTPRTPPRREEESFVRFAQFKARQEALVRQRSEEDRLRLLALENQVSEDARLAEEARLFIAQQEAEFEGQRVERAATKEQNRLRAEMKARERYMQFKGTVADVAPDRVSEVCEAQDSAAIETARMRLTQVDELLHSPQSTLHSEHSEVVMVTQQQQQQQRVVSVIRSSEEQPSTTRHTTQCASGEEVMLSEV